MTIGTAPICMYCINYDLNAPKLVCKAFPDGIPEDIIFSKVDHHKPFDGDNGIQFELMPGAKEPDNFTMQLHSNQTSSENQTKSGCKMPARVKLPPIAQKDVAADDATDEIVINSELNDDWIRSLPGYKDVEAIHEELARKHAASQGGTQKLSS